MASFQGLCPHQSVPVEMDESMTSSSLDLALPASCKQCSGHTETSKRLQEHDYERARGAANNVSQWRLPESLHQHEPRAACYVAPEPRFIPPTHSGGQFADVWPHGLREQAPLYVQDFMVNQSRGFASSSNWPQDHSVEEAEYLEPPLSLKSGVNYSNCVPSQYPAAACMPGPNPMQESRLRQCACCPPANLPRHKNNYYHHKHDYPADPCKEPQHHQPSWPPPNNRLQRKDASHGSEPQYVAPLRDVMHEVSVNRSLQAGPAPATREFRRTISLSEECRNVFITYSVDTAKEIIPFAKFLTDQGFKPAIDIFDNPIRKMGIIKWMDRFLNDKSVLIIVVISPKYKEDVEGDGDGDDEHGLHTKYIHNQIQNEFIQQGCLNFRLVPVVFPNASKRHVPNWLRSTRIYHWPQDTQDLLLRLLREERYIIPQRGADLTLTVRPL
ncbi:adapter protein CIKS [Sander lucioperca]|uniref:adapter protein CIKS n=1 Tax=Sander lucioperca TaxID=283035 RepID=UPI00125DCB46|nr:adapter protein CIKS [Sander lucioperca]XP_035851672.1 adapter protein CIKS [Sander lucioperca]XP_035851673.1 adapter protein CIKS [Sander lucioperca]